MGSKILNIIKKIEEGILFLFLAVILLACFFQVIGRYTPLPFSSAFEEIAVNLFIWMTLLGAGVCVRTHSHMRMDIIDTFLPEKIKPYVDMIRELIVGVVFVSASATERTRDFCGLFLLHIAKYAANRCIYSTNLSIPFCAAPL